MLFFSEEHIKSCFWEFVGTGTVETLKRQKAYYIYKAYCIIFDTYISKAYDYQHD